VGNLKKWPEISRNTCRMPGMKNQKRSTRSRFAVLRHVCKLFPTISQPGWTNFEMARMRRRKNCNSQYANRRKFRTQSKAGVPPNNRLAIVPAEAGNPVVILSQSLAREQFEDAELG